MKNENSKNSKNMANFEAFLWDISSSIILLFLKSVVWTEKEIRINFVKMLLKIIYISPKKYSLSYGMGL